MFFISCSLFIILTKKNVRHKVDLPHVHTKWNFIYLKALKQSNMLNILHLANENAKPLMLHNKHKKACVIKLNIPKMSYMTIRN